MSWMSLSSIEGWSHVVKTRKSNRGLGLPPSGMVRFAFEPPLFKEARMKSLFLSWLQQHTSKGVFVGLTLQT
jgi:hypothetical protein